MAPSTQQQWNVQGKQGFDSLVFNEEASVPEPGAKDVLVKRESMLRLNQRLSA